MIRSALACLLIGPLVILAQLAVSHVHGVSDPHSAHSPGDYVLSAQARGGFAAGSILLLIVALAVLRGRQSVTRVQAARQVLSSYSVRAPPRLV